MNREIKFRAKTANPNEVENHNSYWVYGLLEDTGDKDYPYSIAGCFIKPETIGQFSNAIDRNNNEIFEGDILKMYFGQKVEVKFLDGCFQYYLNEKSHRPFDKTENMNLSIIGNIIENPELLVGSCS